MSEGHEHDHDDHAHGEPSNAQEAVQFLLVGAGIVLVIRLIVAAFGLWGGDASGDALAQACAPFRNGYPLIGPHTVVVGGLPMIPRLAVAVLFMLTMGLLFALVMLPFGGLLKRGALRAAVLGGRIGLVLGSAWAIYALLCLPPQHVVVAQDKLVRYEAPAFLGTIPWPLTSTERAYPWNEVQALEAGGPRNNELPSVLARTADGTFFVARHITVPLDPGPEQAERSADAERLAAALDAFRR